MSHNDVLISEKLKRFELAVLAHKEAPQISTAQELALARHEVVKLIKNAE